MKPELKIWTLATLAALALSLPPKAYAAALYWDGNNVSADADGGAGSWDNVTANWNTAATAGSSTTWNNAANDTAVFGGIAGAVSTTAGGVTVGGLQFDFPGYALNGDPITFGTTGSISGYGSATITAILGGTDGLTKTGTGILTLRGTAVNTLTGGLTLNGGTLLADFTNMGTATNLLDSSNSVTLGGGILSVKGKATGVTSQTLGNVTVNAGGGRILGDKNAGTSTTLDLGTITATSSGSSLLVGAGGTNANLPILTTTSDKDATGIYGGRVAYFNGTANTGYDWATSTGSGAYTLAAYSAYTSTLPTSGSSSSTNYSITPGITLAASESVNTLKIVGSGTALALGANTLTLENGGLLSVGTTAQTISGTAGGTRLTAGNGSGAYDLIIHQYISSGNGLTISAVIGNNGANPVSLVKAGTGTLVLSGANTYSGNTYANSGLLEFSSIALSGFGGGSGRNIFVAPGANVRRSAMDNSFLNRLNETSEEFGVLTGTTSNSFNLSSSTGANLPNAFVYGWAGNGAKTEYSGTITPGGGAYRLGFPGGSGLFGLTNAAPITGTNGLIIGGGSVELVGAKTFSGPTLVRNGGRLGLAAITGGGGVALSLQHSVLEVGTSANTGTIWFESGSASGPITGSVATTSAVLGGLSGSRNLASVYSTTTGANNSQATAVANVTGFTLNTGSGVNVSYSGAIANFAVGTTLTKTGSGTQALSGASTYSGATTVSNGTLVVANSTGSATGTGSVSVAGSATLAGTGQISGPVTVDGFLIPGADAIGNLTVNNTLTLGASSTTSMQVARSGVILSHDRLVGVSTLTVGGTLTVTTAPGDTLINGNSFPLFEAASYVGTFTTVNLPALDAGLFWNTSQLYTTGTIFIESSLTGQTITFNSLANNIFGDATFDLAATASSGLPVSYSSSNLAVATISAGTVTIVGGGVTVITASQAGDGTYAAATPVDQTLTVNTATQSISFDVLPAKIFGDVPFDLSATSTSGLPVSFSSSNPAVATVVGTTVTIVGGGSTTITASQSGNSNYASATSIQRSLEVSPAAQSITFDPLPAKNMGDAPFALSATSTSGLPISFSSSNPSVATVTGNTVAIVGGGSTTITASQVGNTNYAPAASVPQNLVVNASAFGSFHWDGTDISANADGGTGTWNTTTENWDTAALAGEPSLWFNANNNTAVFGGISGTVTLDAGGINAGALRFDISGYTLTGSTLTLGSPGAVSGRGNATLSSILAGSDGLAKSGFGTLTLNSSSVSPLTGGLTVNGGTLLADFANLSTPTNFFHNSNSVTLGGGILSLRGNSSTNSAQTLGNVIVKTSGGQVFVNPNGSSRTATLTLGDIATTQTASTLTIGKLSAASGTAILTTTSGTLVNGIYGARQVFFNGTAATGHDWATTVSGFAPFTLSGLASYTALPTSGASATVNYNWTASSTLTDSFPVHTLKLAPAATSQTLALGANLLTVEGGGILKTTSNSMTLSGTAGGIRLTAGAGSNYELIVAVAGATGNALTLNAVIGDNGANPVSLVKTGDNTLILGGANTYSGNTYVNLGILDFTNISLAGFSGGSGQNIFVAPGAGIQRTPITGPFLARLAPTDEEISIMTQTGTSSFNLAVSATPNAFIGGWVGNNGKIHQTLNYTPTNHTYRLGASLNRGVQCVLNSFMDDNGPTPRSLVIGSTTVGLFASHTHSGDTLLRTGATLYLGNANALQNSPLDTGSTASAHTGFFRCSTGTNGVVGDTSVTHPVFGGLKGSRHLASVYGSETILVGHPSTNIIGFTLNPVAGQAPVYSGIIANFAANTTLTKSGLGTQVFTANQTYTGITTITEGILQLGNGGTIGSLATSAVITHGTFAINRSDNLTLPYPISGNGGLLKQGAGTLTLGTSPAYAGNTTVSTGTLVISAPNTANDNSTVTIADSGAALQLDFAGTDTVADLYLGDTRMSPGVYKAIGSPASGTPIAQLTGPGTLTVIGDVVPPTVLSFARSLTARALPVGSALTYTVTFSEDIDADSASIADFSNAGTASLTVSSVTETSPGVFSVAVSPTSPGSLRLQIPVGATLTDTAGNFLVTTAAIAETTAVAIYAPDPVSPTFVGVSSVGNSSGSTLSLSLPSGVKPGDLLIANIAQFGASSGNPSLPGWTRVDGRILGNNTSLYGAVFYKVATIGENASPTFNLAGTSPSAAGIILAFSGVETSGLPFDVTPGTIYTANSATATVGPAPQVTTVSPNASLLMLGMSAGTPAVTWSNWAATSPAVLAELCDLQGSGSGSAATSLGAAWAVQTTPGATGTGTALLSTSARNGALLLSLKPAYSDSLLAALAALKAHVRGDTLLTGPEIVAHKATIVAQQSRLGSSANAQAAALDLVLDYDTFQGPLWVARTLPNRVDLTDDLHYTLYTVMQALMDWSYTSTNLVNQPDLLNHFAFGSSANFPGPCAAPADPNETHSVTIQGNFLNTFGSPTIHEENGARKPTGIYLAPGSIATVTVPSSMVGRGYKVRVGAHSWDYSNKPFLLRLDRSSRTYDIVSTETLVASPLGGGIYIEVPAYVTDVGLVSIQIKNAVRSPYFSAKSFHATSSLEWQTERNHPGPWADFQSDKFLLTVPKSWIYSMTGAQAIQLMADWDTASDMVNDLMGYPRLRGKEGMYEMVDVLIKAGVYSPGYPSVNNTVSCGPTGPTGNGYANSYLVRGPQFSPYYQFHELGHGYLFPKFPGEVESVVNLLHVPVLNRGFGMSLDEAFRTSMGYNAYSNLNTTAIAWMMCDNFVNGVAMEGVEKQYQLKGHAKWVEIARLFGWEKVNAFYYGMNLDEENGLPILGDVDSLLLRLSKAVGVDIRPLYQFWGVPPINNTNLGNSIAAANLPKSAALYDALVAYKALVPANNATFQTFATNWWGHEPLLTGYEEENNHARRWSTYDEAMATTTATRVQTILDLYFPAGRPSEILTWAGQWPGTDLSDPTADPDGDGLPTSIEWVIGGNPTAAGNDAALAPTLNTVSEPANYVFSFRRRDSAQADANTTITAQYDFDLGGSWNTATHGANGITVDATAVPEPGFHTVVVRIPKTLAPEGKIFTRLRVEVAP